MYTSRAEVFEYYNSFHIESGEQPPLVSVVVPVYNGARSIKRTLESVSAQTHRRLEILVIDDGSEDDTAAIVRQHRAVDDRISLLQQSNSGVACARNTGLHHARGEYVAFIDADDLWHPTRIAKHVDMMSLSGEKVALVYSPCRWIDEHDNVIGSACDYGCRGSVLLRLIYSNFVGNGSALLVRRTAALEVGGFDPSLRHNGIEGCEDYLLQLNIAQRYEFALVPEYLIGYRVYWPRMSSDGARMQRSKQCVLERIRSERPDLPSAPFELLQLRSTPARPSTFMRVAGIATKHHSFSSLLYQARLKEKLARLWRTTAASPLQRNDSARDKRFMDYHPAEARCTVPRCDDFAMHYLAELEAAFRCGARAMFPGLRQTPGHIIG